MYCFVRAPASPPDPLAMPPIEIVMIARILQWGRENIADILVSKIVFDPMILQTMIMDQLSEFARKADQKEYFGLLPITIVRIKAIGTISHHMPIRYTRPVQTSNTRNNMGV
jgi:hypothetical protein